MLAACLFVGLLSAALAFPTVNPDFEPFMRDDNGTADGMERWGYVDVRPGAHKFWWLYYTYHADTYANRPWIIWLQGGPGSSSTGYGNFELIGPLDINLNERNETWVKSASVLFIDNPVGTGYSYVDSPDLYTTTNLEIALDLVELTKVFLTNYPEFSTIPLYIFGESYGGKMGSEFALELQRAKDRGEVTVDLRGIANGNAWLSPEDSVLEWGPHLYYMSNLDDTGLAAVDEAALSTKEAIDAGLWALATARWGYTENVVWNYSNRVDFYNILKYTPPSGLDLAKEYNIPKSKKNIQMTIDPILYNIHLAPFERGPLDDLMNGVIKDKLQIIPANLTFGAASGIVFDILEVDFMKPVIHILDQLLMETDLEVIIYQGALDLICLTKGALRLVNKMTWPGIPTYHSREKIPHMDPAYEFQTELFSKAYENFKFYWIINAGHMVPKDYPTAARRFLERVLFDMDR